jgi:hypothetical protein
MLPATFERDVWQMILRRLAEALRTQNWFTVVLEIAIVVVGIFIGLQADDWNENRKERQAEYSRLVALKQNVDTSIELLRRERRNAKGANQALRYLLKPAQDVDDETILQNLRYGLTYGATFTPEINVYDDLKSSGELALLSDSDLRSALAKMDSRLSAVTLAQEDLLTVQQLNIDPFLMDSIDLYPVYAADFGLDVDQNPAKLPADFLSDHLSRNRILMKLDLVVYVEEVLEQADESLADVQAKIDSIIGAGAAGRD